MIKGPCSQCSATTTPGAALMFSGPGAGVALGTLFGEPLYHASLDPDDYRALLAAHGFAVVAYVPEDPACGAHSVWLARREEGHLSGEPGGVRP